MIPDPPPGGWTRIGAKWLVRPPYGPSVALCPLSRVIRQDAHGLTVQGVVEAAGRRWVLFDGRWSEVGGQREQGQEHRPLPS